MISRSERGRGVAAAALTCVKPLARDEGIIFDAMCRNRIGTPRVSIAMRWRRALVAFLVVAAGFAPIANAACDLEYLAGQLGLAGAGAAAEVTAPSPSVPHDEDGACCGHVPGAVVVEAKMPLADGALSLSSTGPVVLAAAHPPGIRAERRGPVIRQHALAPPEHAFRRVPQLLL